MLIWPTNKTGCGDKRGVFVVRRFRARGLEWSILLHEARMSKRDCLRKGLDVLRDTEQI